jgi:hypothetical protein
MQGRDVAPLYLAPAAPAWRTEFFYEHAIVRNKEFIPASEALVRRDWKYFFWPDFGVEQLFHLKVDPLEEHDVVNVAAHAGVLAELRQRFKQLKAGAAAGAPL